MNWLTRLFRRRAVAAPLPVPLTPAAERERFLAADHRSELCRRAQAFARLGFAVDDALDMAQQSYAETIKAKRERAA